MKLLLQNTVLIIGFLIMATIAFIKVMIWLPKVETVYQVAMFLCLVGTMFFCLVYAELLSIENKILRVLENEEEE